MPDVERDEIRRATPDEAAEVARLLQAFNTEYGEPTPAVRVLAKRVRELLAEGEIAVMLAGEPAIGVAVFRFRPSLWGSAADVHLEELYVVPARRGRETGRRLLEAAMDAAREAGADHFELTTSEDDTAARSLYEICGMTNREGAPDGPRMLYYEIDLQRPADASP